MVGGLLDIVEVKVLAHVAGSAGRSCWGFCPQAVKSRRRRSSLQHRRRATLLEMHSAGRHKFKTKAFENESTLNSLQHLGMCIFKQYSNSCASAADHCQANTGEDKRRPRTRPGFKQETLFHFCGSATLSYFQRLSPLLEVLFSLFVEG